MDQFRRRNPLFGDGFDDFMGDDFFSEFEEEFRRMQEHMSHLFDEALRGDEHDHLRRYVYGFSMHSDPDGKSVIEEFGNVPREGEDRVPGQREPLVDVIDGKEDVTVIAEIPGVDKRDIDVKADDKTLAISVPNGSGGYHKELDLPAEVDPGTIKAEYKNGILEVKLRRKQPGSGARRKVKVE